MVKIIKFVVKGILVPKGRPRFTKRGFCYTPKKTKQGEANFLAQAVQYAPNKPLQGALKVVIRVIKPKPKSKPKGVYFFTTRPDLDNFVKSCLDPLNGVFWRDDAQIVKIDAEKLYGEPARTEIEIYELSAEEEQITIVGNESIKQLRISEG